MAMTDDEIRRFNEAMLDAIQTMNGLTAETMRLTAAEKARAEKAAEQKAKADAAFGAVAALGKAFVSYNKAIYDGESANKAAASSMDGLAEAAKFAGVGLALLIPGGPLIKAVVAGLGLLASKVVEVGKVLATQTDTVYKSYQQLAEAGATGAGAATELTKSLFKVGLGVSKYNDFIRIVKDNSQTLANFGGTVTQGRKVLETTMESLTDKQRIQLEMMGLDRVGQAEATLGYIKQQRLLTIGTKLQMDTSSAAVMRYIKETDELTRITGLNRKEQEKLQEDAMRNEAYMATLSQIAEEQGPEAAKQVQNALVMAMKSGGPEIAKQFQDSLSGFVGASDESGKALMATNGKMQEFTQKLRAGQVKDIDTTAKEMERVAKAYGETAKQFRGQAQMMNFGPTFGSFYEAVTFGKVGVEGFANAVKKAQKQADDAQKTDAATRDLAEAENNARKTEINQQHTILLGMAAYARTQVGVTEALLRLSEAALAAAESLHKIPKKDEGPPVGPVPSTAEAKSDREKAETAVLDLQKERENSQKKVDDQNDAIKKLEKALADAKAQQNQQEVARLEAEIEALRAERRKEMQQHQDNRLKEFDARRQAEIARAREETARRKKSMEEGVTGKREPLPSKPAAPAAPPAAPPGGKTAAPAAPAAPASGPAAPPGGKTTAPAAPAAPPGGKTAAPAAGPAAAPAATPPASPGSTSEATTGTPPTALALLEQKGRKHLEEIFVFGKRGPDSTKERFLQLEDKLESAAIAAAQNFWEQTKKPIQLNSAVRTKEEQQKLWEQTDPNTYNPRTGLARHKQTGLPVLHPDLGGSHQNGTGLDIQNTSLNSLDPLAQASFATFLRQPLGRDDAVHWSLSDGGIATGPKSGYPATLHGTEAVVPLPDGKQIPVKLDFSAEAAMKPGGIGPTLSGTNEYTGYNMGPISTDLSFVKNLASSIGVFDKATQTITNPALWKEIIGTGIATNYEIGETKIGISQLPNLGEEMAQRVNEIVAEKGVDQTEAFKTMIGEFKSALTDAMSKMNGNQGDTDIRGLLSDLVSEQRQANDISNKILSYAQN